MAGQYIGVSVKRKEDPKLLTGRGKYVADVRLINMVHATVFRSPYAHARIHAVEVSRARSLPGVVGVFTVNELRLIDPIPMRHSPRPALRECLQRPLAVDRVRYVGEPVALVVATSRYLAEDALELIEADFEPLPVVADGRRGMAPGAPVLHESLGSNVVERIEMRVGDPQQALAGAPVRLRETFAVQRHTAVPMETRGLLAAFDRGTGLLTVWGAAKVPHFNRRVLADLLGYPEHLIHLIETDVGGGFGIRGEFYPEDFLVPWAAMRLGRPVQWVEDRREHFLASNHSREQWHDVEIGARRDGKIVALIDRVIVDMGAYIRTNGFVVPERTAAYLPGPYRIRNYLAEVYCVHTNKTPIGSYRAPGRYECTFVRERIIDLLARHLGLDPVDVRRRNFIQPEEMPYDVGTKAFGHNVVYDSGDYPSTFETALEAVNYKAIRADQANARRQGRHLGIGIGFVVEKSGAGPWESARVQVDGSGRVVVFSGSASVGQGLETILAQICGEVFAVKPEEITVLHGDTALIPFGLGAWGSRGAIMAGNAVLEATRQVRAKALAVAAHLLEAHIDDLVLENGVVLVRGVPDRAVTLRDLSRACMPGQSLPPGVEAGLEATYYFEASDTPHPFGTHVAIVEVDLGTGVVKLLKYLIAYDVGKAINPRLVEGQLVGGLAQGIGGALLEELAYDGEGQLLSGSFMDYLLPTAIEMPEEIDVRILENAPSPLNPLGVKGAGEGGTAGAGAAIANAIEDALAPVGIRVTSLPLSPTTIRRLLTAAHAE